MKIRDIVVDEIGKNGVVVEDLLRRYRHNTPANVRAARRSIVERALAAGRTLSELSRALRFDRASIRYWKQGSAT